LEESAVLLYKQNVNLQSVKPFVLPGIFVLFFGFCAAAAQNRENKLATADQRRIIGFLLNDKFKGSNEETVYLSTANIPPEIRKDFPSPQNVRVRLISPESAAASELCAYEFGEFQFIDKFVSVSFGNCREGLAYDFVKDGGDWKGVSTVISRELFY
jgi:hypothetical protein